MKKIMIFLCALMICARVFCAEPLNKIIAVVGDAPITQLDLDHQVQFIKLQLEETKAAMPPKDVLEKQVLQNLINTDLQVQAAKERGIRVSHQEVTNAISGIAKSQGVDVQSLYHNVESEGLTTEAYRQQISDQLFVKELMQRYVMSTIVVTDMEVEAFKKSQAAAKGQHQQYNVGDILIALPDAPSTEDIEKARQKATQLYDELTMKRLVFSEVAMAESSGSTALEGGDLGWRTAAELPSSFSDAVINMEKGEVAGPIRAGNGFHILQLTDVRASDEGDVNDDSIKEAIFKSKFDEAAMSFVLTLRAQAHIEIME